MRFAVCFLLVGACRCASEQADPRELAIVGESTRWRRGDRFPDSSAWFDGARISLVAARGEIIGLQVFHRDAGSLTIRLLASVAAIAGYDVEQHEVPRPSTAMYGGSQGAHARARRCSARGGQWRVDVSVRGHGGPTPRARRVDRPLHRRGPRRFTHALDLQRRAAARWRNGAGRAHARHPHVGMDRASLGDPGLVRVGRDVLARSPQPTPPSRVGSARALDPRSDSVSFDDGEDHGNLDGVLLLPRDGGCQRTLRLAALRRGLLDRALLELAARCDANAAAAIAADIVPRALGDAGDDREPSWPIDEASWERARRRLIDAASCTQPLQR